MTEEEPLSSPVLNGEGGCRRRLNDENTAKISKSTMLAIFIKFAVFLFLNIFAITLACFVDSHVYFMREAQGI